MSLGNVLGFKFNHAPGIRTVDGEITAWPESLGALPTTEQIAEWTAEYEAAEAVPASVTRFQARAALFSAGHFEAVEAIMAHAETPMLTKLAWQDAQTFERNSPTVLQLGTALGLNAAQLDALFIAASQITA